jgi:hypothetical protein
MLVHCVALFAFALNYQQVDALQYPTYGSFASDVRLTFRNALQFNVQGDEVYNAAIEVTALYCTEIFTVCYVLKHNYICFV